MGVEIAHNNRVASHIVKEKFKVGTISGGARRIRRDVRVIDGDTLVTKMKLYGLELEMRIIINSSIDVDRRIFNVMANKNSEAAAAAPRTIPAKKRVAGERGIRHVGAELGFLNTCDFDVVLV